MANKTFNNVRIQLKRDTATNWEKNNPVLLEGEEILVDTGSGELRMKVGDGTKTYTQLPFTDEKLRALIAANKITVDETLSETSTNPVQNKTLAKKIADLEALLEEKSQVQINIWEAED